MLYELQALLCERTIRWGGIRTNDKYTFGHLGRTEETQLEQTGQRPSNGQSQALALTRRYWFRVLFKDAVPNTGIRRRMASKWPQGVVRNVEEAMHTDGTTEAGRGHDQLVCEVVRRQWTECRRHVTWRKCSVSYLMSLIRLQTSSSYITIWRTKNMKGRPSVRSPGLYGMYSFGVSD